MHGDPFKPSPEGGRAGFAEWIVKHHPVRFALTLSNIFTLSKSCTVYCKLKIVGYASVIDKRKLILCMHLKWVLIILTTFNQLQCLILHSLVEIFVARILDKWKISFPGGCKDPSCYCLYLCYGYGVNRKVE
jgi:hypothetical protein